jgi:acetoin utilization protein AcuB
MLVKNYMTRHPIMIEPHQRVVEAQKIMVENGIHHLPVVGDGKKLLGMIIPQNLQISPERLGSLEVWEITRYLADLTVEKVMTKGKDLHTIDAEATLEDAANLMIKHNLSGLVVMADEVVGGVITQTDLLLERQELLGATVPGWRITLRVPDRRGEFSRLTRAISEEGWGIMSLGSVRTPKDSTHWDIVLKVRNCDKDELMAILNGIQDQQIIDVRETDVYPT